MSYIYDMLDDILSLLFPRLCYGCGTHLMRNEKLFCTECYILIPRTNYHLETDNPVEKLFWGRCNIKRAAAFSFYNRDSRIRKLIHNLKYKGVREIGRELGKIYGLSLKNSGFLEGIDLIIPVPLHHSKKRIRGFNQAEIISEGLSEASGIPVDTKTLERVTLTSTQTKRSRYERWVNVDGIFNIADRSVLNGKHVLLVDDVITTGSTIESCVNEISKCGEATITVVALAVALA
jgi:ComF family protein